MDTKDSEIVLSALNLYAKKKGYGGWQDFCRLTNKPNDLVMFSEILLKKLKAVSKK